ncbi:hypothetical protein CKAH01_08029 [Colletotrichum kahawae]|uniref:Uncharacterized protein n=1 Tax=Colletotrichum kahawae TaxID=34407 RepID=A0AAD9Y438_COLKA|nr:hypothetical protein CKAH01_08029 [Colletotrichum kahawae]
MQPVQISPFTNVRVRIAAVFSHGMPADYAEPLASPTGLPRPSSGPSSVDANGLGSLPPLPHLRPPLPSFRADLIQNPAPEDAVRLTPVIRPSPTDIN